MRTTFLPFHLPSIDESEIQSVAETLRSGWLTTGAKVRRLESEFCRYTGAAHAVALNSGTAAMHLALDAIGLREGDEVIVPSMTFAATAEVVLYFKARPVLVDCDIRSLNIDPAAIQRAISPKTKAIIPVHFAGQPAEMDTIVRIARESGVKVIEDAAHALPSKDGDRAVGTIGDLTCFSFYANKTMTTGEGGMATTENPEWADRMRIMSLHGISRDAWKRYTTEGSWYYEILHAGYKYNMTDIAAAIGLEQLRKCDSFWQARKNIAAAYDKGFSDVPEISTPRERPGVQHSWHLYVIQLNLERLRITRNAFIEILKKRNIGTSVHFIPLHLHPLYRDRFGYRPGDCPIASEVFSRIVSLPIYPGMSQADTRDVLEAIRGIIAENRR